MEEMWPTRRAEVADGGVGEGAAAAAVARARRGCDAHDVLARIRRRAGLAATPWLPAKAHGMT